MRYLKKTNYCWVNLCFILFAFSYRDHALSFSFDSRHYLPVPLRPMHISENKYFIDAVSWIADLRELISNVNREHKYHWAVLDLDLNVRLVRSETKWLPMRRTQLTRFLRLGVQPQREEGYCTSFSGISCAYTFVVCRDRQTHAFR